MNRRQFVRAGLAGAVAAAAPAATTQAAEPSSPPRLRLGFLGTGYSHGPAKLRIAQASPDWELVGAWEPTPSGRKVCGELGVPLLSRDDVLARSEVIAVESEIRDHAPLARLALAAGRHVHLEKPPALRFADVEELAGLARAGNLRLQTGFMWRYHPGFRAIREAVERGWLGEVFLVRGHISNHLPPALRTEWAAFPGGAMFELGSHLVDATVRLLGRPRKVTPFLRRQGRRDDALQDNNVAVLEYDRATAVLVNTALQASGGPVRSFEVLGTGGSAVLAPIEPGELILDLAAPAGPYARGRQVVPLPPYRRHEDDLAELAAAVRGERPLTVDLDTELRVAETLFRICGE